MKSDFDASSASLYHSGNRLARFEADEYHRSVEPILASRCVTCHGCTSAPCSAKLSSQEMLLRGATKENYYKKRIQAAVFPEDKIGAKTFFPIVHKNLEENMMFQFLKLGSKNTTDADPQGPFDLKSDQERRAAYAANYETVCPKDSNEFKAFSTKFPQSGMPLGLPRLADNEHETLMRWLAEHGTAALNKDVSEKHMQPSNPSVVADWEAYLNRTATNVPMPSTLVARYLYEHWFNAHIAFEEMPGEFFRLVRTSTPPGAGAADPVELVTEVPTDDPSSGQRFFYRFKKITDVIVQKSHVVFSLSQPKIEDFKNLFEPKDLPWKVTSLPNYKSGDPFSNFAEIPAEIRHRFMLENAHYIADSMVRAPVCTGRSATYAIADHFWVFFLKPESDPSSGARVKLSKKGVDSLSLDVNAWLAANQVKERFVNNYVYLQEYEKSLRQDLKNRNKTGLDMSDLWFGEPLRPSGPSRNRNAWQSITRHDTSTTVQFGLRGGTPQSVWVLSYANFERLYYNLVVNFKYWEDIKHKIGTWRSMSHERLDGEDLFLSFLPPEKRNEVRMRWSGGLEFDQDFGVLKPVLESATGLKLPSQPIKRYIDLYPLQSSIGDSPRTGITLTGI